MIPLEIQISKLKLFNKSREHLFSQDNHTTAQLLLQEVQELIAQLQECEITGEAMPVALELADVLIFTLTLCIELGLNPSEVIDLKIQRNAAKFPVSATSVKEAKQAWKAQGGDLAWSHKL